MYDTSEVKSVTWDRWSWCADAMTRRMNVTSGRRDCPTKQTPRELSSDRKSCKTTKSELGNYYHLRAMYWITTWPFWRSAMELWVRTDAAMISFNSFSELHFSPFKCWVKFRFAKMRHCMSRYWSGAQNEVIFYIIFVTVKIVCWKCLQEAVTRDLVSAFHNFVGLFLCVVNILSCYLVIS